MRGLLLLLLLALTGCTQLIFHPYREHLIDPAELGVEVESHYFTTADGLRLHGWLLPAKGEKVAGNILFLHGNAENISTHIGSVWWLPKHGFNVFLFDYRGYGLSQGAPTLDGLMLDFQAALDTFGAIEGVKEQGLVVFGQSLGAAIAISGLARMPQREEIRGLVVEGAMTSFRELGRELLANSWFTWPLQWPLSLAIDDRYRPIDDIAKLKGLPLLIIHSRTDDVIPFHHGEALFKAAAEPKQFWAVQQARHIAAFVDEGNQLRLVDWLNSLEP
jgi:fermentation-respiration switch protein FrsA (DUF1100 family)